MWPWGKIEYRFHPTRRWRFDWAWPELKVAVELDGRLHNTWKRWTGDMEKFNESTILGWRVFHITPADVKQGRADALMKRIWKEMLGYDEERDEAEGSATLKDAKAQGSQEGS